MMNQLKSMKPQVTKAVAGGLVGTVVMTLMMYFVAPNMTGRTMDIAEFTSISHLAAAALTRLPVMLPNIPP